MAADEERELGDTEMSRVTLMLIILDFIGSFWSIDSLSIYQLNVIYHVKEHSFSF